MIHEKINYSIIIPHKNIPKLLQRCLDSIPRRDDVQIIIVDDNSDPDKVDFEKFPGLGDPHIEVVFTKEGKGAGYARNVGLTKAVGKWLLFADADDFFNDCVNDILNEYVNAEVDIIYFKHNSVDSDSGETIGPRCPHFNTYIDNWLCTPRKDNYLLRYFHSSSWAKIFRKDIINKHRILFDEVSISNDETFAYLTGFYANFISVDTRTLYCVTRRQGSIRQSKRTAENAFDQFYVHSKRYRFFSEHGIQHNTRLSFIKKLIKWCFFNRVYYNKAKNVLLNLGFTSSEVVRLCFYILLTYMHNRIAVRILPSFMHIKISMGIFPYVRKIMRI